MALKDISKEFRDRLLSKNLKTPPDIVENLSNIVGKPNLRNYQDAIGKDVRISSGNDVVDPGTLDTVSEQPRQNMLKFNFENPEDVVAGDIDITENQRLKALYWGGIGEQAQISDVQPNKDVKDVGSIGDVARIMNLKRNRSGFSADEAGRNDRLASAREDLGHEVNITVRQGESFKPLADTNTYERGYLNLNRYVPPTLNIYNTEVKNLDRIAGRNQYINVGGSTMQGVNPRTYSPIEFLTNRTTTAPLPFITGTATLENETELMNIAAERIKFSFKKRLEEELTEEMVGRIGIFDATTNPSAALDLIKNPNENIFHKNYTITVPDNPLAKIGTFAAKLIGVNFPSSIIPGDNEVLRPGCFSDETNRRKGIKSKNRSRLFLEYSSAGQKASLFKSLTMNKYTPDYDIDKQSGFDQSFDRLVDALNKLTGFLGTERPSGKYYVGRTDGDVSEIMSDEQGFINKSNEYLTQAWKDSDEYEPSISDYGDMAGTIIWSSDKYDDINSVRNNTDATFSSDFRNRFVDCSIMDTTQKLMDKESINKVMSQIRDRFYDGFTLYSKGSKVKNVNVNNENQLQNKYRIQDEFCRTFTKVNPYSQVSDLVRNKELIRKERFSVMSRFNNYNIYPSELNVNSGFDRMGEKRARKYMLSIENLAWKDYDEFDNLPACEKGPNGGRVMWFPPYDVQYTDHTTANWNTHNFVGRPEPVYSYSYAERTGSLQFKVVVDHPSILNLLVDKELANLSDNDVDEILDSFIAGCLEFDIFELARYWGVFSTSEIEYFKEQIENFNGNRTTEENQQKLSDVDQEEPQINNVSSSLEDPGGIKTNLKDKFIVFPNDVPNPTNTTINDVKPINEYVESFYDVLSDNDNKVNGIAANQFKNEFKKIKTQLTQMGDITQGKHVTIHVEATASPIADQQYNKGLAGRRLISFVLWLSDLIGGVHENGDPITVDRLVGDVPPYQLSQLTIYKKNKELSTKERVTVVLDSVREITKDEVLKPFNTDAYSFSKVSGDSVTTITCTPDSYERGNDSFNVECAVDSLPAIYARRVKILSVEMENTTDATTNISRSYNEDVQDNFNLSVTKRDIAQRILNKFVSECDYFEFLRENTPIVFSTLRDKLKYFSPAFHSTTPEGLNSRLTFLQQCMRPGDTITEGSDDSCDAQNTAFGRPTICVLRIGDFYNGRVVINDINIGQDNTTWDLNPEGIGVQPMIANVNINFKFIGGHSIREPVDRLQNALSFNFYANADVYDSRTFANTDKEEREAVNRQRSFFDDNELDLQNIVDRVEDIDPRDKVNVDSSSVFLGDVQKSFEPQVADTSVFQSEYGSKDVFLFDVDYRNVFESFYQKYDDYLTEYINYQQELNNNVNPMLVNSVILSEGNNRTRTYYTPGQDGHPLLENSNNKQNLRPYLFAQEGLFKLPSGGSLTHPTNSVQPPVLKSLKMPLPPDIANISETIEKHKANMELRIDEGLIKPIMKLQDTYKSFSLVKRRAINRVFKRKFREYYDNIVSTYLDGKIPQLNSDFEDLVFDLEKVNVVLGGVDGQVLDTGQNSYFEVLPNGVKLNLSINEYNIFNPVYNFRVPQEDGTSLIKDYSTINNYLDDKYGGINYLKSYFDTFCTNNGLPYFDFGGGSWNANGGINTGDKTVSVSSDYEYTTTFEKINYEVFSLGQNVYHFFLNDATPFAKPNTVYFSFEENDVTFSETSDEAKMTLFVSSENLVSRPISNSSSAYSSFASSLNGLFNFVYKVGEKEFNDAKNEYNQKYIHDGNGKFEPNAKLPLGSEGYQSSGVSSNFVGNKSLPSSIKGMTATFYNYEEALFYDFYRDVDEIVDEIQTELNSAGEIRSRPNRVGQEKVNAFVGALRTSLNSVVNSADKIMEDVKSENKSRIDKLNTRFGEVNIFASNSATDDYLLKLRKTSNPDRSGLERLENYYNLKRNL